MLYSVVSNKMGVILSNKCLVFGAVNGTFIFQRISDAIRHMLAEEDIHVWNYIDDVFAAVESEGSEYKFHRVHTLISELGLTLNEQKAQAPCEKMDIMGITVDVTTSSLYIPASELNDIITACEETAKRTTITKRELQSLLGKLLYISRVIRPARAFLNRMLDTLQTTGEGQHIRVAGGFKSDLDWFTAFSQGFN